MQKDGQRIKIGNKSIRLIRASWFRKMIMLYYRLRIIFCWSPELTIKYAKWLGVDVGENAVIFDVRFGSEPWLIKIGDNTWVTAGVSFITHDCSIVTAINGPFGIKNPETMNRYGKIVIGNNCFIGINALILPNVKVGDNCIIGAGAIVTKNVPDGSIVAGNPARIVGTVAEFAKKAHQESLPIPSDWPDAEARRKTIRPFFFS